MSLSVLIPTHNSEAALPQLLDRLTAEEITEVVVADRNSTDNTVGLARSYGADLSRIAGGTSAQRLNAAISLTSSQVLWVLLPRTRVPRNSASLILDYLAEDDRAVGGVFRVTTSDASVVQLAGRALGHFLSLGECPSTGLFCRRRALLSVGGFPDVADPVSEASSLLRKAGRFLRLRPALRLLTDAELADG